MSVLQKIPLPPHTPAGEGQAHAQFPVEDLQCRVQLLLLLLSQYRQSFLTLTLIGDLTEQSWAAVGSTAHEGEREAQGQVTRRPLDQ